LLLELAIMLNLLVSSEWKERGNATMASSDYIVARIVGN
jgi:hypothetical protein